MLEQGNQYNEFTVESHTPLGAEVNPPPAVPADQTPYASQPSIDEVHLLNLDAPCFT